MINMNGNEEEEIKKQKMEEMKQQLYEQQRQQQKQLEVEMQLEKLLRKILTPEAKARLGNVRIANKELYNQVVQLVLYLYKNGQVEGKIEEAQLKALLEKLSSGKKEIKIKRK